MLHRIFCFLAIILPSVASAQGLTPEALRAQLDERAGAANAFQSMLNDPDPARSRAAMELMIQSKEPDLVRQAIDFGLLAADPDVRRFAFEAFMNQRPTLLIRLVMPEGASEKFPGNFRNVTEGTVLDDGTASYALNIGPFNEEKNCYLETERAWCAAVLTPDGASFVTRNHNHQGRAITSNLIFQEDGTLAGSSTVWDVPGGFPTTLQITP